MVCVIVYSRVSVVSDNVTKVDERFVRRGVMV